MKTNIEMARQAGVRDDGHRFEFSEYKYFERFVELVRADERARLHPKRVKEDDYCRGDERYYANE